MGANKTQLLLSDAIHHSPKTVSIDHMSTNNTSHVSGTLPNEPPVVNYRMPSFKS